MGARQARSTTLEWGVDAFQSPTDHVHLSGSIALDRWPSVENAAQPGSAQSDQPNASTHDFGCTEAWFEPFYPYRVPLSVDWNDYATWPRYLQRYRRAQVSLLNLCGLKDTAAGRYGVQPFDLHHAPSLLAGQIIVYPFGDTSVRLRVGVNGGVATEPRIERLEPQTVIRPEVALSPLHWLRAWAIDRAQWFARVGPYAGQPADGERVDDFPLVLNVAGRPPMLKEVRHGR